MNIRTGEIWGEPVSAPRVSRGKTYLHECSDLRESQQVYGLSESEIRGWGAGVSHTGTLDWAGPTSVPIQKKIEHKVVDS